MRSIALLRAPAVLARADATIYPEIPREPQQPMVNAVVEFFQQRSTITARMYRLAAASIPLTAKGRYRSGQTGQTVNLLALRLRWFESSPAQILRMRHIGSRGATVYCSDNTGLRVERSKSAEIADSTALVFDFSACSLSGLFAGHLRVGRRIHRHRRIRRVRRRPRQVVALAGGLHSPLMADLRLPGH